MKVKYLVFLAVILSVTSLCIALLVLWRSTLENSLPSGVKEIEIINGVVENVTFDSKVYRLSLRHFSEYAEKTDLKIESYEGWNIREIKLGNSILTSDLRITFKETKVNSIVVWVEKVES